MKLCLFELEFPSYKPMELPLALKRKSTGVFQKKNFIIFPPIFSWHQTSLSVERRSVGFLLQNVLPTNSWSFFWQQEKLNMIYLKLYFLELEFPSNKSMELLLVLIECQWVFFFLNFIIFLSIFFWHQEKIDGFFSTKSLT